MIFLLSTFSLDDMSIMSLFDFIILIYGAYSAYTAQQMKKTGTPPTWLVSQQDLGRIHKPQEFCDRMRPKTMLFGIICMLYGIYGLIESFYIKNDFAEAAGVTVFVIAMVWFIISLQNAKRDHIR